MPPVSGAAGLVAAGGGAAGLESRLDRRGRPCSVPLGPVQPAFGTPGRPARVAPGRSARVASGPVAARPVAVPPVSKAGWIDAGGRVRCRWGRFSLLSARRDVLPASRRDVLPGSRLGQWRRGRWRCGRSRKQAGSTRAAVFGAAGAGSACFRHAGTSCPRRAGTSCPRRVWAVDRAAGGGAAGLESRLDRHGRPYSVPLGPVQPAFGTSGRSARVASGPFSGRRPCPGSGCRRGRTRA